MNYIFEKERIYSLNDEGKIIAEITFKDGVIEHTFVGESLRGQGVAAALVSKAVEEIEKQGLKPKATCSYALKWLDKNR